MTDITTMLKNLFAKIAEVLGRTLTTKEKQDVQNSLGIKKTVKFPYIYYIQSGDVAVVDPAALAKQGITDVFVKVSRVSTNSNYYKTFLPTVISKFKSSAIRVHAWIACFIDAAGKWVDPNNLASRNDIIATVDGIKKISGVYGIHLDYLRYPGTAKGQTSAITSMVKTIRERTSGLVLTAAVMPEGASNAQYYGQDYAALAKYLDAIVPMVYKGNYKASRDWITSATKYIVGKAPGKVVIALQTYNSDQDTTKLAVTSLNSDIEAARAGGANGIALFRYGLSNFSKPTDPTSTPSTQTITMVEVIAAAKVVAEYIQVNKKAPGTVVVGSKNVNIDTFRRLMSQIIVNLSDNKKDNLTVKEVGAAPTPISGMVTGQLQKADYLDACKRLISWTDQNGKTPNYVSTPLGNLSPLNVADMWSMALKFYADEKVLPKYINVQSVGDPGQPVSIPSELKVYLATTANCQVNDPTIQSKSKSLKTAQSIFNFVRDNMKYSLYYNTRLGAVKGLSQKIGNCCTHAHLVIALARAVNIPARYRHGSCKFGDGKYYGHVWAQLYVDGKWMDADAINAKNSLGVIKNWDTKTYTLWNTYKELPF